MIRKHIKEENLVFYFRIAYLLMLMMGNTNLTFQWVGFDIINYAVGFFGIALLVLRVIRARSYTKTPGIVFLAGLVVLYGLSSLWNYSYGGFSGLASNGKATIWMACQMFLLYAFDMPSKEALKKELRVMSWIIVCFNFFSVLVSYGMLLTNYSKFVMKGDSPIMYGVVYNRLWGTFIEPNYGAVVTVVGALLSLRLFCENKNGWLRAFHVANMVLSVMYIIYSDSRTGMVVLMVAVVLYSFLTLLYQKLNDRRRLLPVLACGLISICIAVGIVGSFAIIKPIGLMPRKACMQLVSSMGQAAEKPNVDAPDKETKPSDEALEIGRNEADINNDISNRRFDIWMSGLEILKESPVLGTTFRNLVPFAQKELPDTYIVHNDNKIFWDLHNCLMNVLVCQGIPALLLFVSFAFIVLKKMFAYFLQKDRLMIREQTLLVSALLAIACGAMFNSMIMYVSTIETAIFWLFLGYGMQICRLKEVEDA